ncbi:MAG: Eco57I restriction-modification methylase domain-containing protein, partial [Promethearchaeota archaeon]
MTPNFPHSPSRTHIPYSVIPALPITKQIRIVQLFFTNLKKQKHRTSIQKNFLENLSKLKESNFIEIFNTCTPIGRNLWKFHDFCFIYAPEMEDHDLFIEKKSLNLLKTIKNTLMLKTTEWVCLIQQDSIFIFHLSSKGYLIWSPVLKGIAPYFIASILSDNTILDSISDSWRWEFLEKIKTHILNFIVTGVEEDPLNIENNKRFNSQTFFFIDSFLKVKENFIQHINRGFDSIESCYDFTQINRLIQQVLNQPEISDYDPILETLETLKIEENYRNNPFSYYPWILDVSPLTFLEIFPHTKKFGANQKFGEFYTPFELAETIVTRSFDTFLDQRLKKPITSMSVLDPAMGTGILLVFAIEWLVNLTILNSTEDYSLIDLRRKFAYSNVKGVDIDEDSILIYQKFLRSFYLLERETEERGSCLEKTDFINSFITHSKLNQTLQKFDIILSNPPYIAFHSRFAKNFPLKVELKALKNLIPAFCGKRDNTYLLFLGICLQHFLAPEGVVGFVIDHSFLDLPSYKEVREYLLSNYHVSFILSNYNYRKTA